MSKKSRPSLLNRKPKFAVRITKSDGTRVWVDTRTKKEYKTKSEYFVAVKE